MVGDTLQQGPPKEASVLLWAGGSVESARCAAGESLAFFPKASSGGPSGEANEQADLVEGVLTALVGDSGEGVDELAVDVIVVARH